MEILLLILATILLAGWILAPLFSPEPGEPPGPGEPLPDLYLAREQAYESIRDLEFDFHAGKLSEADYLELRAGLQAEALEALRNLDRQGGKADGPAGGGTG
ncbi:MAG: hypothetical protein HY509_05020 [Acidobacteria bacterium]|nr:hypothetical protein [Acidobacteriota bacterium]